MNLAEKTPYYSYDLEKIHKNYSAFEKALPGVVLKYALKSNPMPEIVRTLRGLGSGFEVASKSEIALLIANDVDPREIIFSNPVKIPGDIEFAHRKGITVFAYDSAEEISKISKGAPGASVLLRLRVYERGSVFSLQDKFGAEERQALALVKKAQEAGLRFYGLSFHVGSQSLKLNTWKYALEKVKRIQGVLRAQGIEIEALDLGGGFPYGYRNMKAPSLLDIAKVIRPYIRSLKIPVVFAEPGRFMVANVATLTTSIIHRTVRRGGTWLYLDAGTYNALFEAMNFQGNIQYRVEALENKSTKQASYVLAGPTCDSIDTITTSVRLPHDLKLGDKLRFYDVGAYTNALANGFNGFKPPRAIFDK